MSVVISVKVPKKIKEELERLGINYTEEIRRFLAELIRREKARRVFMEVKELRKSHLN